MSSIALTADERKTLLACLRRPHDPHLRLRAHIILLLADGHSWATIGAVLYCSSRTVARWKTRYQHDGVCGLLGLPRGVPPRFSCHWAALAVEWVTTLSPRFFGFLRSRWSCVLVSLVLWQRHHLQVSPETVRRWLLQAELVWRRPRPVLGRKDSRRAKVLGQLRKLLLQLPRDETVVFEDEVDISLNPKIGCMWMPRGRQAEVVTPGDNDKCYLAGSLHWRSGKLISTRGPKRNATLFAAHLDELRKRLRRYRQIHVILDNATFHSRGQPLYEFLGEHSGRFVFHFLPKYAPELNPIERIWWVLHEQITRNHQCQSLEELVDLVFAWLGDRKRFKVEDAAYHKSKPRSRTG
jgi:transposase